MGYRYLGPRRLKLRSIQSDTAADVRNILKAMVQRQLQGFMMRRKYEQIHFIFGWAFNPSMPVPRFLIIQTPYKHGSRNPSNLPYHLLYHDSSSTVHITNKWQMAHSFNNKQ